MSRSKSRGGRGDVPGQTLIDWKATAKLSPVPGNSPLPALVPEPLVQRLKWDFKETFPQPTPEALKAGVISDEDAEPENVRAIHDEHARELLAVLHDLDAVLDARRRGVDPRNNRAPMLAPAKERLKKFFETEPARLENWFRIQMDTYEQAFGPEAADAFAKAIRAWHSGIEVTTEPAARVVTTTELLPLAQTKIRHARPLRISARLPVPRPLPAAVAAGNFGQEENGKPVRPGSHEVRAITEQQAEKLIDLLDSIASAPANGKAVLLESFQNGIAAYAEDFGQSAASQLEAYVRRQASLDPSTRTCR